MNGLGHCVGGSLWPKENFNEQEHFLEITSAIAQMENWMVWVNDLMSFYKEFDDPRDQTSLVKNYVVSEGITLNQALEKLTQDTLQSSEQMMVVFSQKDPKIMDTIECFMHGYITWHLCDNRYRLKEIYDRTKDIQTEDAMRFRKFYEQAFKVGAIEATEWAYPTVVERLEQRMAEEQAERDEQAALANPEKAQVAQVVLA